MMIAGAIGVVVLLAIVIEPYRMARLTGFLNPTGDPSGAGFQAIQAKIALGSGGIFGVGLGAEPPEGLLPARGAHGHDRRGDRRGAGAGRDLASLVGLFGLFGYAGLRTAQRARDRYAKLLAAGLTSLVLVQAIVNLFAVLGLAPLTGVPLPFVSYGNSSLLVMLAATGLLLNVARGGTARRARATRRAALRDCGRSTAGGPSVAPPRRKERCPAVPRVVIAAGGTAGHVVPALAVADALRDSGAEVSFLGTRERLEAELVPAAGYEIDFLGCAASTAARRCKAAWAAALAAAAVPAARAGAAAPRGATW